LSSNNQNSGGSVYLQCLYSSIDNPFDPTSVSSFTGQGGTNATDIQKTFCDLQKYNNVIYGPCANFYTNITRDFDYQQVYRINEEKPGGAWATIRSYIETVRRVATQTGGVTTATGTSLAQNMITTYCIVNNRAGWVDNTVIRQIINEWALNNNSTVSTALQQQAEDIINNYCQLAGGTAHCDCWTAYKYGANIFTSCQGKTSRACTDINNIAAAFASAPSVFAPQVASLKAAITPQCAVGACVSVIQNASSIYLAPDTFSKLNCPSNIQLCLQSVTIGGSLAPGATINQKCQSTPFNLPSAVPICAT
jgi:hypothetical protein